MSRRAWSDNRTRIDDPAETAAAGSGGFDASFMERAIAIAATEQPHPNPRVGAVIVGSGGEVLGEGAHRRAGEPHAEILALAAAGEAARGATVYVTLEPCSHHGKTPPCAEALIVAGVARVIVGAEDPDQRVNGNGIAALRRAGIDVTAGVLADEAEAMDPGYFHHRRTGKPLVTLKLALTLDGQIAAADRTSKWVTGPEARADGHRLRAESDVIIVGAGTAIDDNPKLDVRLPGYVGRHPRPVVVAGSRPLSGDLVVLERDALVYTPHPIGIGGEEIVIAGNGAVDVTAMIADLGKRGYVSALVEGGAALAGDMVRRGVVDRIIFYLAGKIGGGAGLGAFGGVFATIGEAIPLQIENVTRLGRDLKIETKVGE